MRGHSLCPSFVRRDRRVRWLRSDFVLARFRVHTLSLPGRRRHPRSEVVHNSPRARFHSAARSCYALPWCVTYTRYECLLIECVPLTMQLFFQLSHSGFWGCPHGVLCALGPELSSLRFSRQHVTLNGLLLQGRAFRRRPQRRCQTVRSCGTARTSLGFRVPVCHSTRALCRPGGAVLTSARASLLQFW